MNQGDLLEQAQQGDVEAIATLLNQSLQPHGILGKASLKHDCLKVILEAGIVPDPEQWVESIRSQILGLQIDCIAKVKLCGKQENSFEMDWQEEFDVDNQIIILAENLGKNGSLVDNKSENYYCYSNPKSVVEDDGGPQPLSQNGRGEKTDVTNHLGLLYLDLEINGEGNLYRIGLHCQNWSDDIFQRDLDFAWGRLKEFKEKGLVICGHNFRRFDYGYLIEQQPELYPWEIIDTLELSLLAFPLEASHKLNKEYKPSAYASNNPLEDARATEQLLHQIIAELEQKPRSLQETYSWLLTCGSEDADCAYRQFFKRLDVESEETPALETLPEEAIASFDLNYLQEFWQKAAIADFNSRLYLAALIAWNYECNIAQSPQHFSGWLSHQPGFYQIWNALRVLPDYQRYLERFGLEKFRGKQDEAIAAILKGDRPLVVMATGGGKSLCYQISALMLFEIQRGLTVVMSPLQALMADQVKDLEEQGLNIATFINGNIPMQERSQRLQQIREGSKGLLYISPEQLRSPSIRLILQEMPPALWVIDEAHCISQWGQDFRPDYRYVPKFIEELYQQRPLPLLALMTATATVKVQEDIKKLFAESALNIGSLISESTPRTNLEYQAIAVNGNKEQILLQEVEKARQLGGCVLVYTATRKNAERLANLLNQANIEAKYYHGKLNKQEKQEVLEEFKAGELNVVVATCAFGMGINRKDVRAVIHHNMSANLEGYVQETGRAGRDGKPASCILLFDEKDAETIFYLQSQMQLSEADLRNIFISARSIRDRIHGGASDEWFWATLNEILQTSELDEEFASDPEYRDVKIKVALQYLENLGLIERAENQSAYVQFELVCQTDEESQEKFEEYARAKTLPKMQNKQFKKLISAMYLAKAHYIEKEEPIPLDRLSDESGIDPKELTRRIRELQKAGVCSAKIPLTLLVNKGVKGDARTNCDRLREWEEQLLGALLEIQGEREYIQVNLRSLAARLDPERTKKIRAVNLMDILEGWVSQKWVRVTKLNRDLVRIQQLDGVLENLDPQKDLANAILEVIYEKLSAKKGARLRVVYELEQLLNDVNEKLRPFKVMEEELSAGLLWLHQRKLIRLTEGANLFHQALKLRVIKGRKETVIGSGYAKIQNYYDEQTRRTHLMLKYGQTEEAAARQQLVEDYFSLSEKEFRKRYPDLFAEAAKRPVTQDDYSRIMGNLNAAQEQIVLAEDPTLLAIAGPGSGKTRTIVRRIAYLVKVKRVDPDRILVLAYNRNAVRELRLRLQELIGAIASRLRVYTFHGLALALLGRTQGNQRLTKDTEFQQLLKEACDLIAEGDESEDADIQVRRIQLLGNVEYIFVDEYQDVAEDEYRLIKLIAGLGDSGDESRSVQINLCAIGDDDQNLYEFRGTSAKYIQQFEEEYRAKRFLLTENYRSTEAIIAAANHLIQHNPKRSKQTPDEQVRINADRQGEIGKPVAAFSFSDRASQAVWVTQKIQSWLRDGVAANDIAVLARQWDILSPIRLLLEREKIATYALKGGDIKLIRNRVTCQLIDELNQESDRIFSPQESVKSWMASRFSAWNRSETEPTVKTLLKIATDLDLERGYGAEEIALPLSAGEVFATLYEYNNSDVNLEENAVLVTSCHGAKGLEFRKVILLTDNFQTSANQIESERRLFYVAMTRAKEELLLCGTHPSQFVRETGVSSKQIEQTGGVFPKPMLYLDLTPKDVNLGDRSTQSQQEIIKNLQEDAPLQMKVNRYGNGWAILTAAGQEIGILSRKGNTELGKQGLQPSRFQFQPSEVTVKSIYRHLQTDEITGEITEDWFLVIPQIRICR